MDRARRAKVALVRVAAVLSISGLWLYAQGPGDVSPLVVPNLFGVVVEFGRFLVSAEVYSALLVTIGEIFVAIVIAGSSGFVIGFWGARSELRARVVEPILVWGYLVPHILFYPLVILWFGVGLSAKIAYAASAAIFPIAFNCLRGFRRIEPGYINVGRAFGASPTQLDWLIKLRAGLPVAAAGLRLGAALSMITVIVAEMLSSTRGLGYLLRFYAGSFSTAKAYAVIAVIMLVAGVFHFAVNKVLPSDEESLR